VACARLLNLMATDAHAGRKPLEAYRDGQQQRCALARALVKEPQGWCCWNEPWQTRLLNCATEELRAEISKILLEEAGVRSFV